MKKLTLVTLTLIVIAAIFSVFNSQQATLAATAETRDGKLSTAGVIVPDMTRDGQLAVNAVYHVSDNAPVLHRFNDCLPYTRSMVIFTGGYSHTAILRHGNCEQAEVKHVRNDKPAATVPTTTEQPESPVVPVIEPEQPTTPEQPVQPVVTDDKPVKEHCNNGAGNGDDCTPGHSSGSNQGQGQQTGDQTNQGENGNKGGNKPNK